MAVKILKKGNLNRANKKLLFNCKNCGCIFTACNMDYKLLHGWYEIDCPYCLKLVTLNDKDAEEQWKGANKDGEEGT